ncbi:MAG: tripartite tricarboxylate transporter substrate binding protein [Pseudomonadota bacterium]|nr:tripartite tricarboxylate transporter substrate binding protein [Pseudomonadota bacterium]
MFRTTRRLALSALALSALAAQAQTSTQTPAPATDAFPSRAITLVVPQAAGGANDAIARVIGQKLAQISGQPVVVDNKPGAGGNIGTASTAKAKPDGYTLLVQADSAQVINPWLYQNTGFDPVKDFAPVAPLATAGYVLVAHPGLPAHNLKELIALAKAKPGHYAIASAGNGTLNHLIGEMLQKAAGIQLTHVPYKGSAAAAADVAGGQVPLSVQSLPSSISLIQSGKLKVLGTVNEKRVAALPSVPTLGETLPGFGKTPWYGLFAPAGTPQPVIDKLNAMVMQVLDDKDVVTKLAGLGTEPFKGSPAQLGALVQADLAQWKQVVADTGAKVD